MAQVRATRGQVPLLDAIVVPISGGGMISGIALAAKGINSKVRSRTVTHLGCEVMRGYQSRGINPNVCSHTVTQSHIHTVTQSHRKMNMPGPLKGGWAYLVQTHHALVDFLVACALVPGMARKTNPCLGRWGLRLSSHFRFAAPPRGVTCWQRLPCPSREAHRPFRYPSRSVGP